MLKEDFRRPRRLIVSSWLDTALLLTAMQVSSGTVTLTKSPTLPEKNCMATISCSSTLDKPISIFLNDSSLTVCNNASCLPQQNKDGSHVYSVTNCEATVTIKSLNRDRDQGKWKCSSVETESIDILVYTFPSNLSLTYGGNTDFDLARSSVTLQCQTDTCTYPAPSVKWYYSDVQGKKARLHKATNATMKGVGGNCSFPENIFISSLILPIYTTWSDNSNKTVNFFCGIEYLDSSRNINSSTSKGITFAVRVSEVELEHSSQSLRNVSSLNVTSGETVTLKCVSGISRPVPTIDWFIGEENKSSGISNTFSFIPRSKDHDKMIFCRAYNVDPKTTVDSGTCRLYVRVQVTEVKLYLNGQPVSDESNLYVQSNKTVSISCVPGESRPDPVIEWYCGSEMKSSSTREFFFTPGNGDHDKPIYCRAYNLHPSKAVESYKPKLSVEDYPVIIYNVSSPLTVNETQSVSVICEAKGNPTPNVIRWKDRQQGNVLRFDNLNRQDTGTYTCEATAQSRNYGTLTSQKQLDIIVQYAPDLKVTVSGTTMQNQTVVLVCEARGVPVKNTFYPWMHMWMNEVIRTGLDGTTNSTHTILLIDRLSLENSGTYICSATNGIRGNKGTFEQKESKFLNVTGVPTIFPKSSIFTGEIGGYLNISIPFYSNPAVVICYIQINGNPLANTRDINRYLLPEDIDFQMYGKLVKLEAESVHIIIQSLSQSNFANYTILLRNPIGQTEFTFQLKLDGPPLPLLRFYFNRFMEDQIVLNFDPGFNGGHDQTFQIEYKAAVGPNSIWQSTAIKDFQEREHQYRLPNGTFSVNVRQPPPGFYLYRMYSWNVKGKSAFSDCIPIIINSGTGEGKNNAGYQLEVIVGNGIVTSVLVVTIIALVIFILKNRSKQKKLQLDKPSDENDVHRHEVGTGLIPTGANTDISNVYERLHNEGQVDNPYLELQRISAATRDSGSRHEVGTGLIPTGANTDISNVYERLQNEGQVDNLYLELQRISAATTEMDSRTEVERLSLHTSKTSSTSNEQESPTSSKSEVHSYLEVAEPTPWSIDETANSWVPSLR